MIRTVTDRCLTLGVDRLCYPSATGRQIYLLREALRCQPRRSQRPCAPGSLGALPGTRTPGLRPGALFCSPTGFSDTPPGLARWRPGLRKTSSASAQPPDSGHGCGDSADVRCVPITDACNAAWICPRVHQPTAEVGSSCKCTLRLPSHSRYMIRHSHPSQVLWLCRSPTLVEGGN